MAKRRLLQLLEGVERLKKVVEDAELRLSPEDFKKFEKDALEEIQRLKAIANE